jgi:hypothetical protein
MLSMIQSFRRVAREDRSVWLSIAALVVSVAAAIWGLFS